MLQALLYTFWARIIYILVNLGSDSWVRMSVREVCADLTDVTLADEYTNSILTDNANQAFQRNVAIQVTEAAGKICNLCK